MMGSKLLKRCSLVNLIPFSKQSINFLFNCCAKVKRNFIVTVSHALYSNYYSVDNKLGDKGCKYIVSLNAPNLQELGVGTKGNIQAKIT